MKSQIINLIKLSSGLFLMILNIGIWINGLFIHRERGMDIILAVPLFITGAFLILGWYKTSRTPQANKSQRWKFILSVLLINYLVLYFIYMIADIIFSPAIDFLNIPGIILPLVLGLFIMGFILSWKYEPYAGVFFLLWYILIFFSQIRYGELRNRGPYILIGIVILLHGILYLCYHFRIKIKKQ
jgi:hypothetical protein